MSKRSESVSAEACVALGASHPKLEAYPNKDLNLGHLAISRESTRQPIPRAGWVVVAGKEIGDHVSSIRFLVLLVLYGITPSIHLLWIPLVIAV